MPDILENPSPLIIRYQMLCDDTSGDLRDQRRVGEFICSLTSLKLRVEPLFKLQIVVYTLAKFAPRIAEVVSHFGFERQVIFEMENEEYEQFADSIRHCSVVDRICIRRMLTDFSQLEVGQFRLLLGTDIYFYKKPKELADFVKDPGGDGVFYMTDVMSFNGVPYQLTYYQHQILAGLLGDFYCLAPSVTLGQEEIEACLRMIDGWEPTGRWSPHPDGHPWEMVHACEQQAAAILLAKFPARAFPADTYHHPANKRYEKSAYERMTVLHSHEPWVLIRKGRMPRELAKKTLQNWRKLGLGVLCREASNPAAFLLRITRKLKRMTKSS